MKRRLLMVAMFLLAGVVMNVALAWALFIDGLGWLSLWGGVRQTPPGDTLPYWVELTILLLPLIWLLHLAALLGLFIFAVFALRRIIRHKRGLCVACGYDLRGNLVAGCPECGWRREAEV